jgi:hypothetical protein
MRVNCRDGWARKWLAIQDVAEIARELKLAERLLDADFPDYRGADPAF